MIPLNENNKLQYLADLLARMLDGYGGMSNNEAGPCLLYLVMFMSFFTIVF